MNIYVVECSDRDDSWIDKAFVREDMAKLYADALNNGTEYNSFWASVKMVELIE